MSNKLAMQRLVKEEMRQQYITEQLRQAKDSHTELKNSKWEWVDKVCEFINEHGEGRVLVDPKNFERSKSKSDDKVFKGILTHTFVKYRVPNHFFDVWDPVLDWAKTSAKEQKKKSHQKATDAAELQREKQIRGALIEKMNKKMNLPTKGLAWFFTVAQGGSLYKSVAKEFLTKKETHALATCPHQLSMGAALVWSVAKCAGAEEGVALRLSKSRLNEWTNLHGLGFDIVRFFASDPPQSVNKVNDLLDYIRDQHQRQPNFALFGRGLTTKLLEKRMHDWHMELSRMKAMGQAKWPGVQIPYWQKSIKNPTSGKNEIWQVSQITDSKTLAAEGNAQRHCVLSYKQRCVSGSCSIWSLTCEGDRKITLEISKDGHIAQARGLANRMPKDQEQKVMNQWHSWYKERLNFLQAGYPDPENFLTHPVDGGANLEEVPAEEIAVVPSAEERALFPQP